MTLIGYAVKAINPKDNSKYELGTYTDYDDAWNYVAHGIDWQPDAIKEDWYFQVIEVDVEDNTFDEY